MLLNNSESCVKQEESQKLVQQNWIEDLVQGFSQSFSYVNKSCSLITEALADGNDVVQYYNGDIDITSSKPVVYQYSWDAAKEKLVRVQSGNNSRVRKLMAKKEKSAENQAS